MRPNSSSGGPKPIIWYDCPLSFVNVDKRTFRNSFFPPPVVTGVVGDDDDAGCLRFASGLLKNALVLLLLLLLDGFFFISSFLAARVDVRPLLLRIIFFMCPFWLVVDFLHTAICYVTLEHVAIHGAPTSGFYNVDCFISHGSHLEHATTILVVAEQSAIFLRQSLGPSLPARLCLFVFRLVSNTLL